MTNSESSEPSTDAPAAPPKELLPRVDVVFNPVSGFGDADAERAEIKQVLGEGYKRVIFHETTPEIDAPELADKALKDGASVVVASGGDGTVTAVAGVLLQDVQKKLAKAKKNHAPVLPRLGVIPRGTGNAFSSALGIPQDAGKAADLINSATVRKVDIAYVNSKTPMMLLCGIGLEAETVKRTSRDLKSRIGPLAYFFAGMRSVAAEERFKMSVHMSDVRYRSRQGGLKRVEMATEEMDLAGVDVSALTIANAAPRTSMLAQGAGEVMPSDGLLEVVCVTPPEGPLNTLFSMVRMVANSLRRDTTPVQRGVLGFRARRITVDCDPPQRVVIDGEEAGTTPITVELSKDPSKRQVDVIVPTEEWKATHKSAIGMALSSPEKIAPKPFNGFFRNAHGLTMFMSRVAMVLAAKPVARPVNTIPHRVVRQLQRTRWR